MTKADESVPLCDELVSVPEGQELVILRNDQNKDIDYEDTEQTNLWRTELERYNSLLRSVHIDIPSLDDPLVERQIEAGARAGQVQRIRIARRDVIVRRIFSRESWTMNGRFNGGWWQQIGKELRSQIRIDDRRTVEIDFRGLHASILSKERGVPLDADPYKVGRLVFDGVGPMEQRAWIKHLVLTAINARSLKQAYQAFREHFPAGHPAKALRNEELKKLLDAFLEKHPHLEDALGADQGIRLMNRDSQIARLVINHFTEQSVPVLCIHDSFLVQEGFEEELQAMMAHASTEVLGGPFETSLTPPARVWDDRYDGDDNPEGLPQLTEGYLQRLEAFRALREEEADLY